MPVSNGSCKGNIDQTCTYLSKTYGETYLQVTAHLSLVAINLEDMKDNNGKIN